MSRGVITRGIIILTVLTLIVLSGCSQSVITNNETTAASTQATTLNDDSQTTSSVSESDNTSEQTTSLSETSAEPSKNDVTTKPDENTNNQRQNKLFVYGKEVTDGNEVVFKTEEDGTPYAEIPFLAVVKAMGAKITKENDGTYTIGYNGETYTLNPDKCLLKLKDDNDKNNVLIVPPGGIRHFEVINNDLMVDSGTFSTFLLFKADSKVTVDYDNKIVKIIQK